MGHAFFFSFEKLEDLLCFFLTEDLFSWIYPFHCQLAVRFLELSDPLEKHGQTAGSCRLQTTCCDSRRQVQALQEINLLESSCSAALTGSRLYDLQ
jgi:hypothetical protein